MLIQSSLRTQLYFDMKSTRVPIYELLVLPKRYEFSIMLVYFRYTIEMSQKYIERFQSWTKYLKQYDKLNILIEVSNIR